MKAFFLKVYAKVKAVLAKLFEFFENQDGGFSSRRLAGLALVVVGIVGWFMDKSETICSVLMGMGAALLGLTTTDNRPAL